MVNSGLSFWQSMTTKLILLCLFIVAVFGVIVVTMVSSFRTVDELTSTIITRDVNRMIQNGQVARDLSMVLTETNLLVSTFYGFDNLLQKESERISKATDSILSGGMEEEMRTILVRFRSSLSLLLQQCATMNRLHSEVHQRNEILHSVFSRLEEYISKKIVDHVLAGDDFMAYEQIGALIPSYREPLLQIAVAFSKLKPAQQHNQNTQGIIETLDNLHLRLRTLLASDAKVSAYGLQLLAGVRDYKKTIADFEVEMSVFSERLNTLDVIKGQTLATMKRMDELSANAAQFMKDEITGVTGRSVQFVVTITTVVAIILGILIYTFLLWHIRRPMAAILRGIASVGEGDLQVRIHLDRDDEWNDIEKALNRMIEDLSESYDRLCSNNTQLIRTHAEVERNMQILEAEITQRQEAEKETAKLHQQLQHAQKMEAIGTLAGGVAHDFNNLLQGIQGYSELLLMKPEGKKSKELQEILRAAKRGGELTRQLLTFSRKVESKLCSVDINLIISELGGLWERTIPKMIDVTLRLKANISSVNADASQIEQVLMNLAVNARDAMPSGGRLTISTGELVLNQEDDTALPEMVPGSYVLLKVSDTGQGMNQETQNRIFDPFFTTKRIGKGTGLGLAIVYGIVKNHGGHIFCHSEASRGTLFKIYLPAIEQQESIPVIVQETEMPRGDETILLVDDESYIRDIGQQVLTEFGYTVLHAVDGESALQIYDKERERIDLIILDIIMPGMGGLQCLKELTALPSSAKIIVASGYADAPLKECLRQGADDFINKPYDVGQILRVIRRVLDGASES